MSTTTVPVAEWDGVPQMFTIDDRDENCVVIVEVRR